MKGETHEESHRSPGSAGPGSMSEASNTPTHHHGDEIWEHKRGRIWLLVRKLETENRRLRAENHRLRIERRRVLLRGL
jgi:hypothetical protein